MRLYSKAGIRLFGFAATTILLVLTLACINRPMKNAQPDPVGVHFDSLPQSAERDVDILFVIDNSGSMKDEQENLRVNFSALMESLRTIEGGLPNIHVGVASTDLGAGPLASSICNLNGDTGNLLTGGCTNPTGEPYIVDVEALDCPVVKDASGICEPNACGPANCAHEPSTTFVTDSQTGCPRCRNYTGESLEDVFACVADLGTTGCGFEQPLEAMKKALDPVNTHNDGFVRDDAFLAVVLITDEDDCSASAPNLFDESQTALDSTLGPLWSYRCFEFGITCDINTRNPGQRMNCVVRDDPGAMLFPTDSYETFLKELKDPQMLVMAAIAGPVTPSANGVGFDALIGTTEDGFPDLQPSCGGGTGDDGAVPGIRIYSMLEAFNTEEELAQWAYTSICSADFSPALKGIGDRIGGLLAYQCLPTPLKGCSDPGVEFGTPQAAQTCEVNSQCQAQCTVRDIYGRGTDDELRYDVPPCLEILENGTWDKNNTDRALAYAAGHPELRDPSLPVAACWHINYQPGCPQSNGAEILIARQEDPPRRSFSEIYCVQLGAKEQLCNDTRDNDENCLVDMDDPCCNDPASCE
jgi:hypothetical protein